MQNLFIGKGNLAASPSLKRLQGENGDFEVATMRVMFGRYGQNDSGDLEQVGGFWREVELYGNKARACAELLRKGARVLVIGEEREFTARDDDGHEVTVFKVVANDVALQLTRVQSIVFQESSKKGAAESKEAAAQ